MDQYVTARASYPEATSFHYVGHSNGTYLLAAALASCPAIRFDNVVFAGSVVRPDYPWRGLMTSPEAGGTSQVGRVLNYVATRDIVVASVPSALQIAKFADLGGAGHFSFDDHPNLRNIRWVPGKHDAALKDQHWDEIADFVLSGDWPPEDLTAEADPAVARRGEPQVRWVQTLGRVAPAALALAALIVIYPLWLGLGWLAANNVMAFGLGLVATFWLAAKILTRV